jgi:hypothetical protein
MEINLVNTPLNITQWHDNPLPPPPPLHSVPHVASTTSMAHSPPKNYKVPPNDPQVDKGKNHATSPSSKASQSSSIHSKQQ